MKKSPYINLIEYGLKLNMKKEKEMIELFKSLGFHFKLKTGNVIVLDNEDKSREIIINEDILSLYFNNIDIINDSILSTIIDESRYLCYKLNSVYNNSLNDYTFSLFMNKDLLNLQSNLINNYIIKIHPIMDDTISVSLTKDCFSDLKSFKKS